MDDVMQERALLALRDHSLDKLRELTDTNSQACRATFSSAEVLEFARRRASTLLQLIQDHETAVAQLLARS